MDKIQEQERRAAKTQEVHLETLDEQEKRAFAEIMLRNNENAVLREDMNQKEAEWLRQRQQDAGKN